MGQETVTYLTNIVIVVILASLITHHWLRQGHSNAMRWWMIAAWVLAAADVLFAARPILTDWIARIVPTALVTAGHAGLYFGARKSADLPLRPGPVIAAVGLHVIILVCFFAFTPHSDWRKVVNGFVWAGFALASCWTLRHAPAMFWQPLVAPSKAFLLHGLFHCLRLGLGSFFAVRSWTDASAWLQILGDLEVSFFMVALFVSLLVADLQLRHGELTTAMEEVHTLSGLLPICAWCRKVRDDDGYWKRVEDYFASRSQLRFTHGICSDCFEKLNAKRPK
jgi:hypothetical protein